MKNIICRTDTIYSKYVVDSADLADIKVILSDYYYDGFNIDTDNELRDRFENVTMPAWIRSSKEGIDNLTSGNIAVTGEAIRTTHLNDTDQCIAIGIVTIQDKVAYNRYRAIHPDFRGQGYIYEMRWNGLAYLFDYVDYDAFVGELPKNVRLPTFHEYTMLYEKHSLARGKMDEYNVIKLSKEQYLAAKSKPDSAYNNYTYQFEEVY